MSDWSFRQEAFSELMREKSKADKRDQHSLTRDEWIQRYGGQALLDREGFDVVPCDPATCDDSICHGWRVVAKARGTSPE